MFSAATADGAVRGEVLGLPALVLRQYLAGDELPHPAPVDLVVVGEAVALHPLTVCSAMLVVEKGSR
jgi:hypothetical protein